MGLPGGQGEPVAFAAPGKVCHPRCPGSVCQASAAPSPHPAGAWGPCQSGTSSLGGSQAGGPTRERKGWGTGQPPCGVQQGRAGSYFLWVSVRPGLEQQPSRAATAWPPLASEGLRSLLFQQILTDLEKLRHGTHWVLLEKCGELGMVTLRIESALPDTSMRGAWGSPPLASQSPSASLPVILFFLKHTRPRSHMSMHACTHRCM